MRGRKRSTGLLALALVLLMAVGTGSVVSGCGGDDDGADAPAASQGQPGAVVDEGRGASRQGSPEPGEGDDSESAPEGGAGNDSGVDLTTDPSRIRGAVVTESGAVQTLPPDAGAQRTAQENTYSSIKAFGEEAEGEEATDITFALVQYLTAKAQGDWATACARLYGPLIPGLKDIAAGPAGKSPDRLSCPEAFAAASKSVPRPSLLDAAEIDVSSVRRGEEDRAFVIYKTPDTLSADMPMFLEDGLWKVGAVEAYAIAP